MADYVVEAGLKQVKTKLESITIANGYQNTIQSVQRIIWEGQTLAAGTKTIFMKQGPEEMVDQLCAGANTILQCRRRLALAIAMQPDEGEPKSVDELINSLAGDVVKAMLTEPRTFGGYFERVEFAEMTEFDPLEGQRAICFGLGFDIFYRYRTSDPTQQT